MLKMLAGYSLFAAGLLAVVLHPAWKKYYIAGKTACSFAFLAVLVTAGICGEKEAQLRLMLPAFLCCLAGDIFMGFYNRFRRRPQFLAGLFCFLAGHIGFVRWLCAGQPLRGAQLLFPAAAVLLVLGMTGGTYLHTGRLRPYIAVYAFFVALFFTKGVCLPAAEPGTASLMTAAGATLFFLSDISILFLYFYKNRNVWIHIFNLATYYYGMFFLAASLLF